MPRAHCAGSDDHAISTDFIFARRQIQKDRLGASLHRVDYLTFPAGLEGRVIVDQDRRGPTPWFHAKITRETFGRTAPTPQNSNGTLFFCAAAGKHVQGELVVM